VKASPTAIKLSKAHPGTVIPISVSDGAAVEACCKFADDQRTLVEPSCGAALAAASYDPISVSNGIGRVIDSLEPSEKQRNVIVISCGGNCVTRSLLESWREQHVIGSECKSPAESELSSKKTRSDSICSIVKITKKVIEKKPKKIIKISGKK
jgi:hypothetical protein